MGDMVREFLQLHSAENYDWHKRRTGTYEGKFGPHTVFLTPLDSGTVLFFWAGPGVKHRKYREFQPGQHRVQTEEQLRRLADL